MQHDDLFSLKDRTALITGGGSGIGRALAHAMSDAGALIILAGRREGLLVDALGGRAGTAFAVDLLEPEAPRALAVACADAGFKPDILINAAGVNLRQHADAVTPDGWDMTIRLNLSVPFFLAQALVPGMKERGWGRIINIASLQSERAFENGIAYGASKGGVAQLTRAMAEAWSGSGVTANALGPGFFPTELTSSVFADEERAKGLAAKTATGRNGTLDDLVGPAVFLASEASGYVTGQVLYVDGGFTAK